MRNNILVLSIPLLLIGCSSEPDVRGSWKSGDGALLIFEKDGNARLGQEGFKDSAPARYTVRKDTVRVTTVPEDGVSSEEFLLVLREDTLQLHWITRRRSGEVRTTNVEQMSRDVGRPVWKFAFTRISDESVL